MKALLLKDTYVIWKQMKIFLLIILVFSAIPSGFNSAFAVIYAAMLPYTALAYDERSKWDTLAATMPYSPWQIVGSKYALGYLGLAGSILLTLAAQAATRLLGVAFDAASSESVLYAACTGLMMTALSLPAAFRLGVEKGRLMLTALILVCILAVVLLSDRLTQVFSADTSAVSLRIAALIFFAAINAASIALSAKLYEKRRH